MGTILSHDTGRQLDLMTPNDDEMTHFLPAHDFDLQLALEVVLLLLVLLHLFLGLPHLLLEHVQDVGPLHRSRHLAKLLSPRTRRKSPRNRAQNGWQIREIKVGSSPEKDHTKKRAS